MSLRKLYLFTTLAMVVAFAAFAHHAALVPDRSPAYPTGQPVFRTISGVPQAVFRPMHSKDAKDLGAGKLLVASRNLGDPNFAETVVLLVHYDAEGVVGLILNRRTRVPLSQVLDGVKAAKNRSDPVYLGGPVEVAAVSALLRSPAKIEGAKDVFGGVYLISAKSLFEQTISARADPSVFHVYLGYAGWTMDQLRREMELGAWFIFPADAKAVFDSDPDSLWSKMIAKTELKLAGSEPQPLSVGGKHLPEDGHSGSNLTSEPPAGGPARPIRYNRHNMEMAAKVRGNPGNRTEHHHRVDDPVGGRGWHCGVPPHQCGARFRRPKRSQSGVNLFFHSRSAVGLGIVVLTSLITSEIEAADCNWAIHRLFENRSLDRHSFPDELPWESDIDGNDSHRLHSRTTSLPFA
ncbi:MAG TPA: YqgE/AlgH family protein [Terriglobales bacterium]|nr:YqgE/AlgH family protein [Terriglobales bacterium]